MGSIIGITTHMMALMQTVAGAEVTKKAPDIIPMDNNYALITTITNHLYLESFVLTLQSVCNEITNHLYYCHNLSY